MNDETIEKLGGTPGGDAKKQIESFNKIGAYTIPIIAFASWAVGMSYCAYIGGGWNDIEYGDFATHPTLMLSAFLMVGSLSVCCYHLCKYFGIAHDMAVLIRIGLNALVVTLAWLGWYVIWTLHNSGGSHYKGSHSRIGIFVLCLWNVYFVVGFYTFFVAEKNKVKFEELYRVAGIISIVVALWTAALGIMWEEYSYDSARDEYERSRSATVIGGILLVIFLIVGMLMYARTLLPK